MPAEMLTEPSAAASPSPRARWSRLKRFLEYVCATVALIAALSLMSFVGGFVEAFFEEDSSSSPPGDPSAAGVIDSAPFWSPDSRLVAFDRSDYGSPDESSAGASDVFVVRSDGSELRRLTRTSDNETVLGWLSDPLRIVYSTYDRPRGPANVYAVNLHGRARVRLGEVQATDEILALSHDARRALVGTPSPHPKRYALVDFARETRLLLPGRSEDWMWMDGAWSRDDSMLAYVTEENIVIVRGERVVRRIRLRGYDSAAGGLAWSPDGRWLVYGEGGENSSLWLVRMDDGRRSQLRGDGETSDLNPVWSPDGSKIYYEHGSLGDRDGLRVMSPDGTGDKKITTDDWAGGGFLNFEGKGDRWLDTARISPDSTKIAYLLGERGAWKNWSLVGVMNADGTGKSVFPPSV